ncbi:hypothetical protein HMPREF3156_01002 [Neisseria sp. HMSC06F02]|nr:hypothetical protein HMPREF3156_01002 [Neisseria sp. HMSC06F02]
MQLVHAAVGDFDAVFHDDDAVGVAVEFGEGVGAEEDGGAASVEFAHDFVKHLARGGVEACGGFVKQQYFGFAQQRLGEGEALAHAFGVGADAAAGGLGNADALEEFVVFGERLFFEFGVEVEGFDAAEGRVQGDGFGQIADLAAQLRARFAAGAFAQQHDFALGGGNQPEYQFDERGFACAVVSGKTDTFACLQD